MTDANRKLEQGAVRVENVVCKERSYRLEQPPPTKLLIRVGKRMKVAVIA